MNDFNFELELADLTNDNDRRDFALLARFPEFRPIDAARFGGWTEDRLEMLELLNRPTPRCPDQCVTDDDCEWTRG